VSLPASFFVVQPTIPEGVITSPVVAEKIPDYSGERIAYDIKLGPVKMGTAVFKNVSLTKIDDARDAAMVTFETRLARFLDLETIYAHPQTFLPMRVDRDIRAWPKHEKIREEYDQVAYRLQIQNQSGGTSSVITKDSPMHNAILLPYCVRKDEKLAIGWKIPINLPRQQFTLEVVRAEDVSVPAGTFHAYYLKSDPERFEIWITTDARRIPVRIKGSGAIGYTMMMREYAPPAPVVSESGVALAQTVPVVASN
jgi:hypothetical protein